ncbi:MAG TPA: UbiA family prenyltransferase [Bryobacteraceae bacterium]|nr:UbiA family prenyltransferase [Bryobacteraceae bacterium]
MPPLAVDLDGTLVKTDLLLESLIALLKQKPWRVLQLPGWLLKGRAHFKHRVAAEVALDVSTLPYRADLVEFLRTQRAQGRRLVLATAADSQIARKVADHLGLFDHLLSSDGAVNLADEVKRDRLIREFGESGFDYAGNGRTDLPVWSAARKIILVNPSSHLRTGIAKTANVDRVFEDPPAGVATYLKPLRPQHWLKNLLVLAPLLAAHRLDGGSAWSRLTLAFLAFVCVASSGYLVNDLLDLQADRRHPSKRRRAFASGELPLSYAFLMIPVLAGLGYVAGRFISALFPLVVFGYFGLSIVYSLYLKRIAVLDVIVLASLYGLRIFAGSVAVSIWPSHWLEAFSMFLFFSLALVKRYGELTLMKRTNGDGAKARAYESTDAELLAAMGTASGYLSVLVLALYISSGAARHLYGHVELIWLLCPVLFYWISYVWLIAHRGKMPDDPVAFAISDWPSRISGALTLGIVLLAL